MRSPFCIAAPQATEHYMTEHIVQNIKTYFASFVWVTDSNLRKWNKINQNCYVIIFKREMFSMTQNPETKPDK